MEINRASAWLQPGTAPRFSANRVGTILVTEETHMKDKMHDELELWLQEYTWQSVNSRDSLFELPAAYIDPEYDDEVSKDGQIQTH